jgi:glycosyltransferase involved in cell wall biosynthesis
MKTNKSSRVDPAARNLRVLHCLRAPVGGLFRHVCDLAREQSNAGYDVAILCSDEPNDPATLKKLGELAEHCALGVKRISLGRLPGISDFRALMSCSALVGETYPDVIHGHGAKGGVLSRLVPSSRPVVRVYTPHGGSIHYGPRSPAGIVFGAAERLMLKRTDALIFESSFARSVFLDRFGASSTRGVVVHNGLAPNEFEEVEVGSTASDFVFLGELRALKGIFTLIDAVAIIKKSHDVSLAVVGDGPDQVALFEKTKALGLEANVQFYGPMSARDAFAYGRMVVMPSHNDSFPYVALEAIAAGRPILATRTGGVPEIFGPLKENLIAPRDAQALAERMVQFLIDPSFEEGVARELWQRAQTHFSIAEMTTGVADVYWEALHKNHSSNASPHLINSGEKLDVVK